MISYADGTEARLRDRVDYHGEPSVVEAIIDTVEQRTEWGLTDRGLMFKNAAFGYVFESIESSSWGGIVFTGRS